MQGPQRDDTSIPSVRMSEKQSGDAVCLCLLPSHLFACGNSQFVNILEAPTKLTNATSVSLCLEECYQKVIYFSTINLTIILLDFHLIYYFKLNFIKMSLYMLYVIMTKYFKNLILRKFIKWFQIPAFMKNLHNLSPLPCFVSSGLRVWRCIFLIENQVFLRELFME